MYPQLLNQIELAERTAPDEISFHPRGSVFPAVLGDLSARMLRTAARGSLLLADRIDPEYRLAA